MTYPLPDHDINKHESEHYPTRSNGIIPTWVKRREGKDARKCINAWLDEMTPEERQQHLENEVQLKRNYEEQKYY
jgi:hypothetical protein